MGYESDFLIASSVGNEEDFVAALGPSLDECSVLGIISRADALKYMISRVIENTTFFYFELTIELLNVKN